MDSYNIYVEKVDIKNINSGNKETRNSQIERDKDDLKKLKGAITSTINPSKRDIDKSKLCHNKAGFTFQVLKKLRSTFC